MDRQEGQKESQEAGQESSREGQTCHRRKNIFRVMFNEITPKAIKAAFEHPGEIDANLVDAQQARRVLDRWSATRFLPCCGTKCAGGSPPDVCKRWRCD